MKTLCLIFFENSARTSSRYEIDGPENLKLSLLDTDAESTWRVYSRKVRKQHRRNKLKQQSFSFFFSSGFMSDSFWKRVRYDRFYEMKY